MQPTPASAGSNERTGPGFLQRAMQRLVGGGGAGPTARELYEAATARAERAEREAEGLQERLRRLEERLADFGLEEDVGSPAGWGLGGSGLAARADVFYCFRLLLGRLPSEAEWPGHLKCVGHPLEDVVRMYLQCLEFAKRDLLKVPVPELVVAELARFRMYVPPADVAVGNDILTKRTYEVAVTAAVERCLRPGMAFVDIGANMGYFSLLAAALVGPGGSVFAFEPAQMNVKLLYLSCLLNGFANVRILPLAAGPAWSLSFYDSAHSNGWVSPIATAPEAVLPRTVVTSAPVSDLLPSDRKIDMIKIDVEGGEFAALAGARRTLERHHPVIVSEFSPPALESISKASGRDYLRLLVDLGYRVSVLRGLETVACGTDLDSVLGCYEASGTDHIDILAE